MACTADFQNIQHFKLNLDLNQNYLRKHFNSFWLKARDIILRRIKINHGR
jgi:hypothetical protein